MNSRFKRWIFLILALAISGGFLWFTGYLVEQLSKREVQEVNKLADAYVKLNLGLDDYSEVLNTIKNSTIPTLLVDEKNQLVDAKNIDSAVLKDTVALERLRSKMGFLNDPIAIHIGRGQTQFIYYKEQEAITLLRYFPYLQLIILTIFIGIAYYTMTIAKKSEQNLLWAGMAKETAHQIGTPLSSIMAWVEVMKADPTQNTENILLDIERDIQRLSVITERFSKIGSLPELKPLSLNIIVEDMVHYMAKRIPKSVELVWKPSEEPLNTNLNANLMSWVMENLIKNAVDAMAGKGRIVVSSFRAGKWAIVEVADNGKGMARSKFKTVFKPGYTTKQRGWGLGLSLAKRIIKDYHQGDIIVKESVLGKGTTFRIKLPIAQKRG